MRVLFTVVHNATHFLRPWVDYHVDHFDEIFVLTHECVGDSCDVLDGIEEAYPYLPILKVTHRYRYDADWLMRVVRRFQAFLLASYDTAWFLAADEFLATRDQPLGDWLDEFERAGRIFGRATGYEIVHRLDLDEPAIDWTAPGPLLRRRRYWYECKKYSKPVGGATPIFWEPGFATATNVSDPPDPGLQLIHLHRIDYEHCLQRHREAVSSEWRPLDKQAGPYRHNRIDEPTLLERWLLCNADNTREFADFSEIPDNIRSLF